MKTWTEILIQLETERAKASREQNIDQYRVIDNKVQNLELLKEASPELLIAAIYAYLRLVILGHGDEEVTKSLQTAIEKAQEGKTNEN